jgi:mono/diheme cytochrome c family protein
MRILVAAAAIIFLAGAALAQEDKIALKPGPGLQNLQENCAACHSLDYVPMNSPFLDRKGWEAEVTKMVKAFGAPVSADEQAKIIDYLAANYAK